MQLWSWRETLVATVAMAAARVACAHGPQQATIAKFGYAPAEITMHVGDTVTWVNNDPIAHTATVKTDPPGGPWEVLIPRASQRQCR